MNSKAIGADFVFAWPNAEIAVMGPEGAAGIIFKKEIAESENREKKHMEKVAEYREQFANPYAAAANGMVDDIIDPRSTRTRIARVLEVLRHKKKCSLKKNHGNIPL